jgi:hypothetical protein
MTDYSDAQGQLTGISDKYYDAAYTVLITNVFDPEIDLLVAFHNAYVVSQSTYASAPASAINAVNALQNHILAQQLSLGNGTAPAAGLPYDDINDYYEDFSTGGETAFTQSPGLIPQGFADISGQAGHAIDAIYVL